MRIVRTTLPVTTTIVYLELSESDLYKLLAGDKLSNYYACGEKIAVDGGAEVYIEIEKQEGIK